VLRRRTDIVTLLVSGFGERSGGGILAVSDRGVEQVDSLSLTGLAVAPGRVARLVRSATEHYGSELLLYDANGVDRYVRLDEVVDPHDVVWDGTHYVVASTTANSLFWLSAQGEVVRRWQATGDGDAWHLNSLALGDGRLYAAAFGRFDHHRDWIEHKHDGRGIVFDVESGRDVLTGLDCPHHPRRLEGSSARAARATGRTRTPVPQSPSSRRRTGASATGSRCPATRSTTSSRLPRSWPTASAAAFARTRCERPSATSWRSSTRSARDLRACGRPATRSRLSTAASRYVHASRSS